MGLNSSCPISRAMIDHWAGEIRKIEERSQALHTISPIEYAKLDLYLLAKYVDDVLTALEKFQIGTRWNPQLKTLIWTPESHQEDLNKDMQSITMREFSKIADSVTKCLNFTWDTPNQHTGGRMPVLDTQMWIGDGARKWGVPAPIMEPGVPLPEHTGQLKRIILYSFYRKSMACQTPMHFRAAAPEKVQDKIQTAVNEYLRRMKNCSRELDSTGVEEVIKE